MIQRLQHSLWFYVGLFLLCRFLVLALLHPIYYTLGGGEEPFVAAIGRELLLGSHFSFSDFLFSPSQGGGKWGHIMVASLMSPFYLIFGYTSFASKLPSLLLFTGTLILWWKIIVRWVNPKAAPFFALLFIFSPPSFTQFSHTALGHNFESVFFTAAAIHSGLQILLDKKYKTTTLIGFGLLSGIGMLFCYVFAITLLSLFLFSLFMLKDKPPLRVYTYSFLAFLVGLSPWALFNLLHNFSGIYVYDEPMWLHFSLNHLSKILLSPRNSILIAAPFSLSLPFWGLSKWLHLAIVLPYLGIGLIVCFARLKGKQKESGKVPALGLFTLFITLNLLLCQAGNFLAPRYFIMSMPFLFALLAWGIASLNSARLKKSVIAIVVLLHFLSLSPILSLAYPGRIFRTKAYSYQWMDEGICKSWKRCAEKYPEIKKKFGIEDLKQFTFSLSRQIASDLASQPIKTPEGDAPIFSAATQLEKSPPPHEILTLLPYFSGRHLAEEHDFALALGFSGYLADIFKYDLDYVLFGLLEASGQEFIPFESLPPNITNNSKLLKSYWRAQGFYIASLNHNLFDRVELLQSHMEQATSHVPKAYRHAFVQGWGKQLYDAWAYNPRNPKIDPRIILDISDSYQESILIGIARAMFEREFDWQIADHLWYFETFTRSFSQNMREHLLQGKIIALEELKTK